MSAIFFYTAVVHASFVAFVVYRVFARAPLRQDEREPFEPAPVQPAPVNLSTAEPAAGAK
jgi:hypothetical protein